MYRAGKGRISTKERRMAICKEDDGYVFGWGYMKRIGDDMYAVP